MWQETSVVRAGDLCVLTGMKLTVTGDTLVSRAGHDATHMPNTSTHDDHDHVVLDGTLMLANGALAGMSSTSRVFYCTVEAPSPSAQLALDTALGHLVTDDPSLLVRRDYEQTVLESCGELHVDVVKVGRHGRRHHAYCRIASCTSTVWTRSSVDSPSTTRRALTRR